MSASNYYDKQVIPAIASFDSNTIDCEHLTKGSFQVVWVDLDNMDGYVSIMLSNDGVSWAEEAKYNADAASGDVIYRMNDITTRYCRVSVDNGTNTAGAYKVIFFGRIR